MLDAIENLLHAPDPYAVVKSDTGEGAVRQPLLHQANPPASAEAIAALASRLNGCSDALLSLYRKHDGLRLYALRDDPECALLLLPLAEMEAAKNALDEWLEIDSLSLDEDETQPWTTSEGFLAYSGYPDWWEDALVFARFGYTPESLIMPTRGEHAGKIFIYEHDGGDETSWVTDSFEALVRTLTQAPLPFLHRYYGTYWRNAESCHG